MTQDPSPKGVYLMIPCAERQQGISLHVSRDDNPSVRLSLSVRLSVWLSSWTASGPIHRPINPIKAVGHRK